MDQTAYRSDVKMKILQIYHSPGWGGTQRHIRSLVLGLRQAGHTVEYAGPEKGWLTQTLSAEGVTCHPVRMRGLFDPRSHLRLIATARRQSIDLIHCHARRANFYAGTAGILTGIPVIATAHTTNSVKGFSRATRVIAISNAVRQSLLAHGVDPQSMQVIHNGVAAAPDLCPASRARQRRELGLGATDVAIVLSGRFLRDKGHDLLIVAVQTLANRNSNARVYLIGADESRFCWQIRESVDAAKLGAQVTFIPYRNDVLPLLAAMDIVVVPSRREGLSLTLLEAASLGRALIGARVGGIPEVIEQGVNGLLFDKDDADGLANCLQELVRDAEKRHRFGVNAAKLAKRDFSIPAMVQKTISVYRDALAHTRRHSRRLAE